ncbi:MAG: hypothetical protein LBJ89_02295, partial [Holosporales bacterium]|nr:hypothetical protein [Holosporales bacterium]
DMTVEDYNWKPDALIGHVRFCGGTAAVMRVAYSRAGWSKEPNTQTSACIKAATQHNFMTFFIVHSPNSCFSGSPGRDCITVAQNFSTNLD